MLDKNQLKESIVYTDWGFEYLGYDNPFSNDKIFFVIDSKKLNNPIINNIVQEFNLRNKFIYCIDLNDRKINQPQAYFYENTHTHYLYEKRFDLHKSNSEKINLLLKEMHKHLFNIYIETRNKISRYIFIPSEFFAYNLPTKTNNGSVEKIIYHFIYCYNVKRSRFEDTFLFLPRYEVDRNSFAYNSSYDSSENTISIFNNFLRDEPYYDEKEHDTLTLLLKDKIHFFNSYNELEKYVCNLSDSIDSYHIESLRKDYDKFKTTPKSSNIFETLQDILTYTDDSFAQPKTRSCFPHNANPIAYFKTIADIENDTFCLGSTKNARLNALKYRGDTIFYSKEGFSIPGEIPVDYFNPYNKLVQYRTSEDNYEINQKEESINNFYSNITSSGSKPKNTKPKDEEPKGLCDFIDNLFFRKSRENK